MATHRPNLARDLVRMHKVISRGLQIGLSKGLEFSESGFAAPERMQGYTCYIHCLGVVLSVHHTSEDLFAFPAFRNVLPTAPYDRLTNDHKEIERQLKELMPAIQVLQGDRREEGLKLNVDALAKISAVWYPHIEVEEKHFSEDKVNAALSAEEQKNIGEEARQHSEGKSEPVYWVIPFVLFNLDHKERASMEAFLPVAVVNELVPTVWKEQWAPMKPFLLD